MVAPKDPEIVREAYALADAIRDAVVRQAGDTRDAARWLDARTNIPRSTWSRRFAHESLITYEDIAEAAQALGMRPSEVVAMVSVGGTSDASDREALPTLPEGVAAKRKDEVDLAAERGEDQGDETDDDRGASS